VEFTRSGDTLTIVRGTGRTDADSHDEGTTVQLVKVFPPSRPEAIIRELLEDFADIDPEFIDFDAWTSESEPHITYLLSGEITSPTGVATLVKEICRDGGCNIWWDEIGQEIRFFAIKPTPGDAPLLDDRAQIMSGSFDQMRQDRERLTDVWIYFGKLDTTDDQQEPRNYARLHIEVDPEAIDLYGKRRTKKIFSRWFPTTAVAGARRASERMLTRFRDPPRRISFSIDMRENIRRTGDIVRIEHFNMQRPNGDTDRVPFQLVSDVDEMDDRLSFRAVEYRVREIADELPTLIIDTDTEEYNVREQFELQIGPVGDAPVFVRVILEEQATLFGDPAITGGGLPPGSKVFMDVFGDWVGRTGTPGSGGTATSVWEAGENRWFNSASPGGAGQDGGDALHMTEDWEVRRFGEAIIAAGPAGSGGGGATAEDGRAFGGGGAGASVRRPGGMPGASGGAANIVGATGESEPGEPGGDSTETTPGLGGEGGGTGFPAGDGGDGVDWAEDGNDGGGGFLNQQGLPTQDVPGGKGGVAGRLAVTNGFDFVIVEGNDETHVFGEVV
jgi:hypothetical protein